MDGKSCRFHLSTVFLLRAESGGETVQGAVERTGESPATTDWPLLT